MSHESNRHFTIGNLAVMLQTCEVRKVVSLLPDCAMASRTCTLNSTCLEAVSRAMCVGAGSWRGFPEPGEDVELASLIKELRRLAHDSKPNANGVVFAATPERMEATIAVLEREANRR
jgi:hypothetical protein